MYSNSRNDVPRVAQRYGTIAAHTRRRASVLVVFVVFCVHMHSFAGLIRRMLQSPTAYLIPLFSSSELTGCGYPGLLDRKNRLDVCPRWESNSRLPACKASTLSTRPGSPLCSDRNDFSHFIYAPYASGKSSAKLAQWFLRRSRLNGFYHIWAWRPS